MTPVSQKQAAESMAEAFSERLAKELGASLWDDHAKETTEALYYGLVKCVEDELYVQEFLPFGFLYRIAGEHGIDRKGMKVPLDEVMQEHILLRDVFWDYQSSVSRHDFLIEKRLCQCFDSILQVTVLAYKATEPGIEDMRILRDQLTGVFNPVYFMTRLEEELRRSERYMRDLTVALIQVGSTFEPHSAEDMEMMRAVSRVLRRNTRASDVLAILEDRKFASILPETKPDLAELAMRRHRERVHAYLASMGGHYGDIDIKTGLAAFPEHGDDGSVLLQEALASIKKGVAGQD